MLKKIVNDNNLWEDGGMRELCHEVFKKAGGNSGDRAIDATEFEVWLNVGWLQTMRALRGEALDGPSRRSFLAGTPAAPAPAPCCSSSTTSSPSSQRPRPSRPRSAAASLISRSVSQSGYDLGSRRGYKGSVYEPPRVRKPPGYDRYAFVQAEGGSIPPRRPPRTSIMLLPAAPALSTPPPGPLSGTSPRSSAPVLFGFNPSAHGPLLGPLLTGGAGPLTAATKAQRSVPRLTASASESKVDWLAEKRHHTSASVMPPPAANIVSSKDLALANGDAQQAIELLVANFAEKEPLWMVKPAKAAPPARPWVLVQGRRGVRR